MLSWVWGYRMEPVHKQISVLSQKVDVLHQMIEQLNSKVSEALSKSHLEPEVGGNFSNYSELKANHLDVLGENPNVLIEQELISSDRYHLSSEIQIQRLTAQLTAAYNRIAALEEQLLAQRIH